MLSHAAGAEASSRARRRSVLDRDLGAEPVRMSRPRPSAHSRQARQLWIRVVPPTFFRKLQEAIFDRLRAEGGGHRAAKRVTSGAGDCSLAQRLATSGPPLSSDFGH